MQSKLPRNKPLNRPKLPKGFESVVIIGLGGVGSIVARYGAVFLASLNENLTLTLVDGDSFELSNATRMLFSNTGNKAMVINDELTPMFIDTRLLLQYVEKYVTPQNLRSLVHEGDLVLLCVDNHATRKLVSRYCEKLKNICLISGGNDGVGLNASGAVRRGTYGNAQIYVRQRGKEITHSLTKFHPEIAKPADKLPTDLHCTDLVISHPQILFANLAAASAMLNTMLLYLCNAMHYSELSFDIADALMRPTIATIK